MSTNPSCKTMNGTYCQLQTDTSNQENVRHALQAIEPINAQTICESMQRESSNQVYQWSSRRGVLSHAAHNFDCYHCSKTKYKNRTIQTDLHTNNTRAFTSLENSSPHKIVFVDMWPFGSSSHVWCSRPERNKTTLLIGVMSALSQWKLCFCVI